MIFYVLSAVHGFTNTLYSVGDLDDSVYKICRRFPEKIRGGGGKATDKMINLFWL